MALPAFSALLPAQGHLRLAQLSTPSLFPILPRCTAEKHQATCTRASSAFVFLHYLSSKVPRITECAEMPPQAEQEGEQHFSWQGFSPPQLHALPRRIPQLSYQFLCAEQQWGPVFFSSLLQEFLKLYYKLNSPLWLLFQSCTSLQKCKLSTPSRDLHKPQQGRNTAVLEDHSYLKYELSSSPPSSIVTTLIFAS